MYRTEDYHTAGEPFRIVVEGAPDLPGPTVADRRATAMEDPAAQRVRAILCSEPLPADDRRRPYKLTSAGGKVLRARLDSLKSVTKIALSRLANA